jgi:vacuolar-type H+-ATPase subunit H
LDEKLLNRVLDIEKQAQSIHDSALNEALELPVRAEKEAQELIEKTRLEAEKEAQIMISNAQAKEECDRITAEMDEKISHSEGLAAANFNRAVSYVIGRVIGRE